MKDAYHADWDVEQGATYVPWERLPLDLTALTHEGAVIDEDSLPPHLKSEYSLILSPAPAQHSPRLADPAPPAPPCAAWPI